MLNINLVITPSKYCVCCFVARAGGGDGDGDDEWTDGRTDG